MVLINKPRRDRVITKKLIDSRRTTIKDINGSIPLDNINETIQTTKYVKFKVIKLILKTFIQNNKYSSLF